MSSGFFLYVSFAGILLTSFSVSTAKKTIEERARTTPSSPALKGSVLKMGFRKGT